ncbi:MAG: hypothetical protein JWN46_3128 [Acidimicrobiales bacterium]|nr:hypothetical protein [Acidimicrobiales bacterium]
MGFFKDVHALSKQAKEIDKTWDPGAQARQANARMAEMNQVFASANAAMSAPPGDAVAATAEVVSVGMAAGMLNTDPIIPVELLVLQPGLPPRPASVSVVVPISQMHRLQAGSSLAVKISASDPSAIAVDWAAS